LNDRFGIQTRGGCSCSGTYGHFLLNVNQETSNRIKDEILHGCNTDKPIWVRLSVHSTITNKKVAFVCTALKELSKNVESWSKDYEYHSIKMIFRIQQ
jgi:selenocysteine lyase/cysteine desulfurase